MEPNNPELLGNSRVFPSMLEYQPLLPLAGLAEDLLEVCELDELDCRLSILLLDVLTQTSLKKNKKICNDKKFLIYFCKIEKCGEKNGSFWVFSLF